MKLAFLLTTLIVSSSATGADSYVLGHGISQKYIAGLESPCVQDGELVCDGVWFRWEIRVDTTLSGPPISGRIRVAVIQHVGIIPAYFKTFRLFVLSPIADPEKRKLLRAEYMLSEFSAAHEMYCLQNKPTELVDYSHLYYGDKNGGLPYCFERQEKK